MRLLPHDEVLVIDHATRVLGLVGLEQLDPLLELQEQQTQEMGPPDIIQA